MRSLPVTIINSEPALTGVRVQPDEPTTDDTIAVDYIFHDPDGDPEAKSEIRWFRRGAQQPSYVLQSAYNDWTELPPDATKRNEQWYFTIRSRDDAVFSDLVTADPVTIGNGIPSITDLNVLPNAPLTDDDLEAVYTFVDTEEDPEFGTEIRWYRKKFGELVFSPQPSYNDRHIVRAADTARDDNWYCEVRPGDGTDLGEMVTSPTITIGNTPPVAMEILSESNQVLRGESVSIISYGQDADAVDNGSDGTLKCQIAYRIGIDAWTTLDVEYKSATERWEAAFMPEPLAKLGEYDIRTRFVDSAEEESDWIVREKMITVGNSPPVIILDPADPFVLDNLLVLEDTMSEFDLGNYANDVEDGKTLTWTLDESSVDESLFQASMLNNRFLEITPVKDMNGQDDITLTVTDKDGGMAEKTDVTIIIDPVNDAPSIPTSVTIIPENPRTVDSLTCVAVGSVDSDNDEVIYRYKWFKNDVLQTDLKSSSVPASRTLKGDSWRCEVTPTDGKVDGPSRSDSLTVANSRPEVTIRSINGNTKDIQITFDLRDDDQDDCDLTVEYWIKGKTWKPATVTESTRGVKQGSITLTWQSLVNEADTLTSDCKLRITPNDGSLAGSPDESSSFLLDNLAPGFTITAIANPIHPRFVDVTVISDEELAKTPNVSAVLNGEQSVDLEMRSIGDEIWTGKVELAIGFGGAVLVAVEGTDLVGNVGEAEIQKEFQIPLPLPQPTEFALRQNYPNPLRTNTSIPYELPQSLVVTIKIYNVTGRLVRTLDEGYRVAGYYLTKDRAAQWDRRDDNGIKVASGVYFYRLEAGSFSDVKKMVVSR